MSERWACRVVEQPRGTQRYRPTQRADEDQLTQEIITLAASMVGTAIGASLRCWSLAVGRSAKIALSVSGVERG